MQKKNKYIKTIEIKTQQRYTGKSKLKIVEPSVGKHAFQIMGEGVLGRPK